VQIGLINNLRAGRSGSQVRKVLDVLREFPNTQHVETDQAGALPDAIADLARRRIDLLLINGGDGTLQHALTEILSQEPFEQLPYIAPLAGGRTNMTAKDLGAQGNPVKGLRDTLRAAHEGRLHERLVHRPVLRLSFDRGRREEYGMFFGSGMIRRAIHLVHDAFPQGKGQGALGAGLVTMGLAVRTAFRPTTGILTPDKIETRLDGEPLPGGEFRLSIATTLDRLYWRLNPYWGEGPGDVRFTAIASDAERFGTAAPGILWGRPLARVTPENGYHSRNLRHAQLRLSCGFTIDGEDFAPRPDEVVTLTADRRVTFVRT